MHYLSAKKAHSLNKGPLFNQVGSITHLSQLGVFCRCRCRREPVQRPWVQHQVAPPVGWPLSPHPHWLPQLLWHDPWLASVMEGKKTTYSVHWLVHLSHDSLYYQWYGWHQWGGVRSEGAAILLEPYWLLLGLWFLLGIIQRESQQLVSEKKSPLCPAHLTCCIGKNTATGKGDGNFEHSWTILQGGGS